MTLIDGLIAAARAPEAYELHDILVGCADAFEQKHPQEGLKWQYLMRTTLQRLREHGDVADAPKSGRPPLTREALVEEFWTLFLKGNGQPQGKFNGYTSIHDACKKCHRCEEIRKEMHDAKGHPIAYETLWHAVRKMHKKKTGRVLRKISLRMKPKLSDTTKAERVQFAIDTLERDAIDHFLDYAIWIDEKAEWVTNNGVLRCYAPVGMKSHFVESDKGMNYKFRVKYQAAVGAQMGALYFEFVAGTTGKTPNNPVRTVPRRRHLHPASLAALLPCLINDSERAGRVAVADA